MNLDVVISQLKALTTSTFNGNVAGSAEYQNGVRNQAWLPLPAAYVVPLDDEAGENLDLTDSQQISVERIGVIVVFDNSSGVAVGDRRGQTASALFEPTKWAIFRALINWRPDSTADNPGVVHPTDPGADHASRGLKYEGGRLIDVDLARLTYQWDFSLEVTITDDDGWQPPATSFDETDIRIVTPEIFIATNAATLTGAVLHFSATPDTVEVGMAVSCITSEGVIELGTTVQSLTSTTVTLSADVLGDGVQDGDVIAFYTILAGEDVPLPQ